MTIPLDTLSTLEDLIDEKEMDLLTLQNAVHELLNDEQKNKTSPSTPHKKTSVKDIRNYKKVVRQADMQLNDIIVAVHNYKKTRPEFRHEATALCQQARDLKAYPRDMINALSDELTRRQNDVVKNAGFVIGSIVGAVAAIKNGLGHNTVSVDRAAEAAGVGSLLIVFHKKISDSFKSAGAAVCRTQKLARAQFQATAKTMCGTKKSIRNSFLLYWAQEVLKEKKAIAKKAIQLGFQPITATPRLTVGSTNKNIRRFLNKKEL